MGSLAFAVLPPSETERPSDRTYVTKWPAVRTRFFWETRPRLSLSERLQRAYLHRRPRKKKKA